MLSCAIDSCSYGEPNQNTTFRIELYQGFKLLAKITTAMESDITTTIYKKKQGLSFNMNTNGMV